MPFDVTIAIRYLVSSRLQSALLVAGVAVGVVVFTFIAALMNGLGVRLTEDVTANVAHVTLEPAPRIPIAGMSSPAGPALYVVQPGHDAKPVIRAYRSLLATLGKMPGVQVAVPEVIGSATLSRGDKDVAVVVTGIEPLRVSAIAPLAGAIVRGHADLGVGDILVGTRLAANLAVDVGDRVILRGAGSPTSHEAIVTVRGVFTLGVEAIDERSVYLELGAAQKLFDIEDGVSIIEIKLDHVWDADAYAEKLARATDLKSTSWLKRNARLQSGLRAQASTGAMIKAFSLLTIAIGVASTLFLSVSRRRSEIGILRSFGIGRAAIVRAFILQGLLIGAIGSLVGVALGDAFAHLLLAVSTTATGATPIPIDPAKGEYFRAILLATLASAVASVLPAWSAARIDPLEAIQS